jgi:hypothetical protein
MKIKLTPYEANFGEMGGIDGPIIIADVDLTEEQKNQLLDSIKNDCVFEIEEISE